MSTPAQIVATLKEASAAYYNGGPLKMDDDTYDGLLERLRELDPRNAYLDEVGAPPAAGAVKLPYPMPSLDKIKPGQDVLARFLSTPGGFVLSEKLDGLSAAWNPETQKLYLRGNGLVGQDVSHLVRHGIQGLSCSCPSNTIVRGELIVPRSEGIPLSRNWVNGQIHQDKPDSKEVKRIHFVAYDILGPALVSRHEQFLLLKAWGFEIPWIHVATMCTEEDLKAALLERRTASAYDTDGIVVGLMQKVGAAVGAAVGAKPPKDCVAFKMPLADQSATTIVREIIWAPSAQEYYIPRIRFDPVVINGATIEFCTGHNARMIFDSKLGPGASIVIRRSGDVIPKLDKVIIPAEEPSFPPEGTWEWIGPAATAVNIRILSGGARLHTAKLHHFFKTLDIPGAGPATAEALVGAGLTTIKAVWDSSSDALSKILGPKTGASLYANLRTALKVPQEYVLMIASSLMPRAVGETKLKALFALETDPRKWTTALKPAGWSSDSLETFLGALPTYLKWRETELGFAGAAAAAAAAAAAEGQPALLYCTSGFRDKALELKAVLYGLQFSENLTANVSFLVVPDGPVKDSTKVRAAAAKKIPVMQRTAFVQQYLS
jgi:NAD-dependent DNA ligase